MIGFLPLADAKMIYRSRQDSNLRGETPLDFKSNALTTRPSQVLHAKGVCGNITRLLSRHKLAHGPHGPHGAVARGESGIAARCVGLTDLRLAGLLLCLQALWLCCST